MPSSHLILCGPLLLLPPIPPSIKGFSNESTLCIRWPKYWSFSFSVSPSNEYSGLISLRMDWLDLLAVQGTLKSLLQHHSSKASILRHSAFFIVQLSRWLLPNRKSLRFSVYLRMPHFSLKSTALRLSCILHSLLTSLKNMIFCWGFSCCYDLSFMSFYILTESRSFSISLILLSSFFMSIVLINYSLVFLPSFYDIKYFKHII